MKYVLLVAALIVAFPIYADDCLDSGVRFRSFADTGGKEVYLGQPDLGVAQNRIERNLVWDSGSTPQDKDFVFTYDLSGDASVSLVEDNVLLEYLTPQPNGIDTLLIDIASRDDDSQVELLNLTVNNVVLGDLSTDGLDRWVFPVDQSASYSVSGTIRYSGSFSNSQENSRVEVRLGKDDCELLPPPPLPEAVPVNSLDRVGTITLMLLTLLFGFLVIRTARS